MFRVTLSDGHYLAGLQLNGNNYVSNQEVTQAMFDGKCSPVTINDGSSDEVHPNMELVQIMEVGDQWWFVLRDISEHELEQLKTRSDIDYLAMMTGVNL